MVEIPTIAAKANEVRANERIHGTFLVRKKVKGVGKTGKSWLQLDLGDQTGSIDARVWDNADSIDAHIDENDIVDVEGNGAYFMDHVQLKVSRITRHEGDLDIADFLPEGSKTGDQLRQEYELQLQNVQLSWIRTLLRCYLDDSAWWRRFVKSPAAKRIHHAYIGGLAEHTLSMMQIARQTGEHYEALGVEPLNVDVLVAGAFLHDSGKVDELSYEDGFAYTDQGRLIGHMQLGIDQLDQYVGSIEGFPPDLHTHLRHMILSHHGEYEYGSPRRPKTIEAIILHFIDNMDARVTIFHDAIRSNNSNGRWTGYESAVGRYIYRSPIDFSSTKNDN